MNQFWLLTKLQMQGIWNPLKMISFRRGKQCSPALLSVFAVLLAVLFASISGVYAYIYATILQPLHALDAIPAMWMAMTSILILCTTVYKVKGTLFHFSDYDMIMSMPIPTTSIVASRIFVLYVYDLVFTVIILCPANLVYGVCSKAGIPFYVLSTLLTLCIPVIPMILGSFLGFVITILSSRFRYRNIVTIVLLFGLFSAYMFGVMQASTAKDPEAMLVGISTLVLRQIYGVYPLAKWYVQAVLEMNWMALFGFVFFSILVLQFFCYVIGKQFKKMNTLIEAFNVRSNYTLKELKTRSILWSLYQKEWKRFLSSPMYVMNSMAGIMLLTIAMIVLIVSGEETLLSLLEVPGLAENLGNYVPMVLLICIGLTCTTAASISLEGKSLWIIKSMPVTPSQIFLGKALVNLTVTIPFIVVDTIICAVLLHMTAIQMISSIVLPSAGALLLSFLGLSFNLKFPRFDWKSEMEVVKQGLPTLLVMLTGIIIGMIPLGILFLVPTISMQWMYFGYSVLLLLITTGIYRRLHKKGTEVFANL